MIVLKEIKIKNFLSHEDTKISFPIGVTVIVGPNGSGKTAIMDAIIHSLLGFRGIRSRSANVDDLIRFGTKFMELDLIFEVDGREYNLNWRREKGGTVNARLQCRSLGLITDSATKTVQEVSKIIGIDKDTLLNSIFIRQGEITNLIEEDPSKRKEIIGRILGLDRLQIAYEKMREIENFMVSEEKKYEVNVNEIKKSINDLMDSINKVRDGVLNGERELNELNGKIKNLEEELKQIYIKKELLDSIQEKYNELCNKKSEIEGKLASINDIINRIEFDLKICLNAKRELESMEIEFSRIPLLERFIEISNEIEKLRLSLEILSGQLKILNELEDLEKQSNELKDNVTKYLTKPTREELNYKINTINEKLSNLRLELQNKHKKRGECIGRIGNLNYNLEIIDQLDVCPVCKTKLSPKHKEHIKEEVSIEINKLKDEIKLIESELSAIDKNIVEIERIKSFLESELSKDINKIEFISSLIKSRRSELLSKIPELKDFEFEIEYVKKLIKGKYEEFDDKKRKYEFEANSIINNLGYKPINPKIELENLKKRKEELTNKVKRYDGLIEDLKNQIVKRDELMNELKVISKSIIELSYDSGIHNEINQKYQLKYIELAKLKGEFNRLNSELTKFKEFLSQLVNRVESKHQELRKIEECLDKIKNAMRVISVIRKAYSKDGIQKLIRQKVTPLISQLATNYIDKFNLDITGIFVNEDLEVRISRGGDLIPLQLLSGGEKVAVAIALRLALARALAEKFSMVIMDEPTIHLDEDRRKVLIDVFKTFRESAITQQMIIITHDRELEDIADTILYVEKVNGVSKVKES